ncbi:MAG: hypothetical protein OQK98_16015 [Gammaproteobacteria bacterium]|nr:hypothetical protein [Gammaproteobacteria bacterium]
MKNVRIISFYMPAGLYEALMLKSSLTNLAGISLGKLEKPGSGAGFFYGVLKDKKKARFDSVFFYLLSLIK